MKKKLFVLTLMLILVLTIVSCKSNCGNNNSSDYNIHTTLQQSYLNDDYVNFSSYANGTQELSLPKAITLKWEESFKGGYNVILSTDDGFNTSTTYYTKKKTIDIYNLMIGKTYYWKVVSVDAKKSSEVSSFYVDAVGPRNLNIDGLTNVRDLGGWHTTDGKVTNQGQIIRSSKFNQDESDEKIITEKGIKILIDELKIKTEIDLRRVDNNENGGITLSPLGNTVNYISIPMRSGGNCLTLNKDVLKDLFQILGDKNNYPIIFHCSIGTDRTGMVAFILNALLGVEEENLYRDYLFSNFGNIGKMRTKSAISDYLSTINRFEGSTLSEKTYTYLLTLGIDANDLDTFITIMKS